MPQRRKPEEPDEFEDFVGEDEGAEGAEDTAGAEREDEFDELLEPFRVDLSQVTDDGGFEPIPPGTYVCEVLDASYSKSRAGNPMLTVRYVVIDGPYIGRQLFDRFVLNNDVALRRLKRLVTRLLGEVDELTAADLPRFSGIPCRVRVTIRETDGFRTNDVRDVMPAGEDVYGF